MECYQWLDLFKVCIMWFKVWSCDLFWGVWFVQGHVSNTKMDIVPSYRVGASKRFTFLFHSTVVLQCECSWKKRCEIVITLVSCTPFLRVLSVVKVLNAYARCTCSLRPMVFYICYVLGPLPAGLCSVSTAFTEPEIQQQYNWLPAKPRPLSESSWN